MTRSDSKAANAANAACRCCLSRRNLLAGAAAFAASAIAPFPPARAQPAAAPFRIDVHHHLTPPDYIAAISGKTSLPPQSSEWSVGKTLDDMDAAGVQVAILSITAPGLWFGDAAAAAKLARGCNDYAAKLVAGNKGRLGSFAALPMPNVNATLSEVTHALDTLKADGVCMFTSYEGKWLGDVAFVPVFEELNRRKATVSVHPTTAACCSNLIHYIPDTVVEFDTETARTIASLIFSGAAGRWPDIKFIFSHAGGTMPMLIERFADLARTRQGTKILPGGVRASLRKFFYDTAQAANPMAMGALRQIVEPTQIVFGSDFPFHTGDAQVKSLAGCGFTAADLRKIQRDNALGLLPRFKT